MDKPNGPLGSFQVNQENGSMQVLLWGTGSSAIRSCKEGLFGRSVTPHNCLALLCGTTEKGRELWYRSELSGNGRRDGQAAFRTGPGSGVKTRAIL